jgi:hypothetical protein
MANFLSRPARRASACTVFLGRRPAASGALVDPDVVLPQIVVHCPESFPALARGYPLASDGTAWQAALQPHPALRLRVVQRKAAFQLEPLAVARQIPPVSAPKALQDVVSRERLRAVRPVTADESV